MSSGNTAEEFVSKVSKRSILSLWCYDNPRGKETGKELCDLLVVCDPYVIVISVKDIVFSETEDRKVGINRWTRRAIDESVKQIGGAERWLRDATHVIRTDGSQGLELPQLVTRQTFRIAVACGSRGEIPISLGADTKDSGYVHVMTERSFDEILGELDTIADLTEYLSVTERYAASSKGLVINGTESDLLGWYLNNGRTLPDQHAFMILTEDIWETVRQKPEFVARKREDREHSYVWDELIETLASSAPHPQDNPAETATGFELALRVMAREHRFSRRLLGQNLKGFLLDAKAGKSRARIMPGLSEARYVIVSFKAADSLKARIEELTMRCFVARHKVAKDVTVIGLGFGPNPDDLGSATNVIYCRWPEWADEQKQAADSIMRELGYFRDPILTRHVGDEFPVK